MQPWLAWHLICMQTVEFLVLLFRSTRFCEYRHGPQGTVKQGSALSRSLVLLQSLIAQRVSEGHQFYRF